MSANIKVTVWNEFYDEKRWPEILDIYPGGVHEAIGGFLKENSDFDVTLKTLEDKEQGLSRETLDNTDVLIWYSHMLQDAVDDKIVDYIVKRVFDGMGLILLHSSIWSKLSVKLLGARGAGTYREIREKERVWIIDRGHPIVSGLTEYFEFPESEMYGEPCDIPTPDELVFISWFAGGNVSRSGYTYKKGAGKVFYFAPGHAWYDVMNRKEFQMVVNNAVRWARPVNNPPVQSSGPVKSLEKLELQEEK